MIAVLSRTEGDCRRLAADLVRQGWKAEAFTDFSALHGMMPQVALIACDYFFFGTEVANPYEMVLSGQTVPFLFFNTPFAPENARALFWYARMEQLLGERFPVAQSDRLWQMVLAVQEALRGQDDGRPGVPQSDGVLEEFRRANRLQDSKYAVLRCFFARRGTPVDEETVCREVWGDYTTSRVNTLYAYVSYLRSLFAGAADCPFTLERAGKRCYRLDLRTAPPVPGGTAPSGSMRALLQTGDVRAFLSSPPEHDIRLDGASVGGALAE